ncbi:hypothetical protein FALBO_13501 [Fusarium albosuccineum]|uniref:NADAR domain-containing protein n=1 Tax=Fusarium albosuccineum TaxID=1237068 RepID=A0A8H4L0I7_9HYPO|nr:hypothetical protein FALBO_13501 [Fusarium albosuccineum]
MGRKSKKPAGPKPPQLEEASPTQAQGTDTDKSYLFFFMPNAKHGEFCQWFPSVFTVSKAEISELVGRSIDETDPDGSIEFNCAEQFMMFCKAARFTDTETQAEILATSSPKLQKRLGRDTAGFTPDGWDPVKSRVVEVGNIAKFTQNEHLRRKLLATGDRILVEAASRDRVWGIGYNEKRAMGFQEHWGENRLGKALMVTREHLKRVEEERGLADS